MNSVWPAPAKPCSDLSMRINVHKSFGERECPGCAMTVEANHNRCPICGYEFPHPSPLRKQVTIWGSLLLLVLFLLLSLRLL